MCIRDRATGKAAAQAQAQAQAHADVADEDRLQVGREVENDDDGGDEDEDGFLDLLNADADEGDEHHSLGFGRNLATPLKQCKGANDTALAGDIVVSANPRVVSIDQSGAAVFQKRPFPPPGARALKASKCRSVFGTPKPPMDPKNPKSVYYTLIQAAANRPRSVYVGGCLKPVTSHSWHGDPAWFLVFDCLGRLVSCSDSDTQHKFRMQQNKAYTVAMIPTGKAQTAIKSFFFALGAEFNIC